jgi:type IV pilus assembly protein PilC
MLYHYLASDQNEHLVEGDIDAESAADVLSLIAGKGLRPISVNALGQKKGSIRMFEGKITVSDKIFLTRYLSLMLRVGTDLLSAINILIADFEKPAIKNLLLEIRDNLSHGKPFHEAFANHPKEFSPVFINLVRAAEASGNLDSTFEDLSVSLGAESDLHNKVKSAFTYPIILLVAALVLFTFLATFALPKIAKVFLESGIKPPTVSKIVFGVGLFINAHIIAFFATIIFGTSGLYYFFFKNASGVRLRDTIMFHLPVIKNIYHDLAVQRFASTFSALLKAGLPIVTALRITADVVGAAEFKESLLRIADEGISKGRSIGESFKRETVFPRVVTNLIAVSEKVGHLEQVLQTLSQFYTGTVDNSVRSLVALLEPVLLMVMGLVVGGIALSIIVPIYQLTTNF